MQMISTEVCFLVSIHLAGQLSFSHLRHVSRQVFWCLIGQLRCPPLLSPRPVWRNSSLGESKHIIQRSLMLERKEVLDDFCFCLDLGQCLPFTAGMHTGWFQMCFGRLMWASRKSATVGPQETREQVIMLNVKQVIACCLYQWILMLNTETMKILLLYGQPWASQTICSQN